MDRSSRIQELMRRHGYLAAALAIVGSTALFIPFRELLGGERWGWPYLLVLGFVAGTAGVGPGLLSAVLAFFAWNFFFIPPYHTLFVASRGDVIHLAAFLVVGTAIGLQTGRLRDRELVAQREERHTAGRVFCTLAIVAACVGFPAMAAAAEVSSATLVEQPAVWDGRVVRLTGEAVGEVMLRGDEAWLHLNDDVYADGSIASGAAPQGYNSGIAVVVSPQDAEVVTVYGDYRHQGDIVRISGVFHAACPEHGGDMDIHATDLSVVRAGMRLTRVPETSSLILLAIALVAAGSAVGAYLIRRPRD